MNRPPAMGK